MAGVSSTRAKQPCWPIRISIRTVKEQRERRNVTTDGTWLQDSTVKLWSVEELQPQAFRRAKSMQARPEDAASRF